MSALSPRDQHIADMIRSHTEPLRYNAEVDRKKIAELEETIRILRKDTTEHLELYTKYLASYKK